MKQQILSGALVLCLCISSQSAAYAYQSDPLLQEGALTEGTVEGPDAGDGVPGAPQEDPSRQEDVSAGESAEGPDADDDVNNAPQGNPPQQEGASGEGTVEGPDVGDGVSTAPPEDPSQQEGVLPEEPEEGPDTSGVVPTALPEDPSQQADVSAQKFTARAAARDNTVPSPAEALADMYAMKEDARYQEGAAWTNEYPYSDATGNYYWNGGTLGGAANISAVGCVAFAFSLSDAAFGSLPARMYGAGGFAYEDIKVGDILRVSNDAHTVIVLEVSDVGVVVAEGNISTGDHKGKVHWGRTISKAEVMSNTSHYITRYPEGYVSPADPEADTSVGSGTLGGGLAWNLTKAGTLTISGQGAMPDFSGTGEQPWSQIENPVRKVVIGDGVTSIGSCAFWNCGVLSAEISSSVATIGNSAFRGSSLISVDIPSSVKTIGDSAFRECGNLSSVTVSEGVETIEQNAFRSCGSLKSIALPASIGEVGDGVFFQCTEMTGVAFAPGGSQVRLGDNIFMECWRLGNVTLPQSIDRIGDGMFQNCGMLTSVEIPKDAESIGANAFSSCSGLAAVVIPDSVTSIGIAAFSNCALTDIYFTGTEAQWSSVQKIGDTMSAVSKVTVHYNYVPATSPDPGPDDSDNNNGGNTGDNNTGGNPGDNTGDNNTGGNPGDNTGDNNTGGNPGDNTGDNNTGGNPGDNTGGNNTGGNTGDNNTGGNTGDNTGGNNTGGNTGDNNTGGNTGDNTGGNNTGGNPGDNTGGNNTGGNTGGNNTGNNSGNTSSGNKPGNNTSSGSDRTESASGSSADIDAAIKAVVEVWKPVTPDEVKRYACVGKEAIQYTQPKDNACQVVMENAMQGPMCFKSFESVLGDYTIGRTYNIYALSKTTYSTDKEIELTIKIPSAIYKEGREYKMICVTEDGKPFVYSDLDSDPETVTIKTDKFYAYALVYRQKQN